MFNDLIDFVDSLLPSVDPKARDKAKAAIKQFEEHGTPFEYLTHSLLPELSQGDIISEIPFMFFDADGSQQIFNAKGMIISTSCHIDQKKMLNIVPLLPITFFAGNNNSQKELKANRIYDYMYVPETGMDDYFIDFSKINTYDKSLILTGIEHQKIERLFSLSQHGYYLFIIKLTVFLMRKEDSGTAEHRTLSS